MPCEPMFPPSRNRARQNIAALTAAGDRRWQLFSHFEIHGAFFFRRFSRFLGALVFGALVSILHGQTSPTLYQFTRFAGRYGFVGAQDGPADVATFNSPTGIEIEGNGNLLVADQSNKLVRRIAPDGSVTTVVGTAGVAGSTDGVGTDARFRGPSRIRASNTGTFYLSETNSIRVITSAGAVTTLPIAAGILNYPDGMAVDQAGNLFIANTAASTILKVLNDGTVVTFAGATNRQGAIDGDSTVARFSHPTSLAFDRSGNLFVSDTETIRKITPSGIVSTYCGVAGDVRSVDGTLVQARFTRAGALAFGPDGNLYVGDLGAILIRRISTDGRVTTVADNRSEFSGVTDIAIDAGGKLYVTTNSQSIYVGVVPPLPAITQQPISTTRIVGSNATFTVATGVTVVTYQWYKDGVPIDGATSSTLTISGATFASAGSYSVVLTNGAGTVTSAPATLTIQAPPPGPLNDNFADAIALVGNNASGTGTNVNATSEFNDPHYDGNSYNSVWWKYTATQFGRLTVSTAGSNFDTVLSIYTGSLGNLQVIGKDDESGPNSTSVASIFVVPGVTYGIEVEGYKGATGNIAISASFTPTMDIYSTNFDAFPSGDNRPLGFDGWLQSNVVAGVVAIVPDPAGGNTARIGLNPTNETAVAMWRPLNFDPAIAGASLVQFSTDVTIVDSTSALYGDRDNFYFVIYNMKGELLGAINFDNTDRHMYRFDGVDFSDVGTFSPGVKYHLSATMNFSTKTWTAILGSTTLFTDQPINVQGRSLTLGDIDAFWGISYLYTPGDNYMLFDNYRVSLVGSAPQVTASPANLTVAAGAGFILTVTAEGTGLTYQWTKNGVAIPGATGPNYSVSSAAASDTGSYVVTVASTGFTFSTAPASVAVLATNDVGRLINLSVRTHAGSGAGTLLAGVVIGGAGTSGIKPVLIRASGPTLGSFGVKDTLANPALQVLNQGTNSLFAANDDWAGDPQVESVATALGAFPFNSPTSKDAAIYVTPASGAYAVKVLGGTGTSDITLAEVYDATPSASYSAATPRLVNVSSRAQVDIGDGILIAGFVIGGSTARTVMIRGIGPTLANFGVPGSLIDPKLQLYQRVNGADVLIATNDDWSSAPAAASIPSIAQQVGAFALTPGSKDAVLLITLPPGVYSAQLSGVNSSTGVGLIELYEVP